MDLSTLILILKLLVGGVSSVLHRIALEKVKSKYYGAQLYFDSLKFEIKLCLEV